jgi:hypothetical protein
MAKNDYPFIAFPNTRFTRALMYLYALRDKVRGKPLFIEAN